ncbi:kinase-like protein [Ceratobasidium sp. AG-I]|nr:kinase-like protein [Ceratobasidium sp. AG-I]
MQLKLGKLIGKGASGYVFRATEIGGIGRVAAVKKSRASLRVKRPHLQHEGRLIQMLQGHPSIPTLFGYGRFEHFEYLSMELLEASLSHLYTESHPVPIQTALVATKQMLSALEYIHSRNIVHRDVKPGNIMASLENTPRLKLIDFGISRHFRTGTPERTDIYSERAHLVGSVNYASLNAHDGIELSRRDDLESLFYSVFCLLRGSLLWSKAVDGRFGIYTSLGMMKHIHQTKRTWSGSMLADGYPEEFGQLLDQVRRLDFNAEPDYPGYFCTLESLCGRLNLEREEKSNWPINLINQPTAPVRLAPPTTCAVLVGQLVNVQVLIGPSIQGYGAHGDDPAVWKDPEYESENWKTTSRPAVVVKIELSFENRHHRITVLPPTRSKLVNTPLVSLDAIAKRHVGPQAKPHWPEPVDTYCYSFDSPCTLVAIETESVPYHWSLAPEQVEVLQKSLSSSHPHPVEDDLKASERLKQGPYYYVYARFTPMLPESLDRTADGTAVEWNGRRGWFDELITINNVRCLEDGWAFGELISNTQADSNSGYEELTSSYVGMDVDAWDNMGGPRSRSITLPYEEEEHLDADIPLDVVPVDVDAPISPNTYSKKASDNVIARLFCGCGADVLLACRRTIELDGYASDDVNAGGGMAQRLMAVWRGRTKGGGCAYWGTGEPICQRGLLQPSQLQSQLPAERNELGFNI